MYRLLDDIAAHRCSYEAPIIGAPFVILIEVPERNRGNALLLDCYDPCFLETEAEVAELDEWLTAARLKAVTPDLFDRRPSRIDGQAVLVAQSSPPAFGWPWLVVCRWPAETTCADLLARGCYSVKAFWSEEQIAVFCVELLARLGREGPVAVSMIRADQVRSEGNA